MAVETFMVATTNDGVCGALVDGVDQAAASRTDGWTVAKIAAANAADFRAGTKQASGTFVSASSRPSLFSPMSNAFKIPAALFGTFAATDWVFTFAVRAGTASSQRGRMRMEVYRSANADGSSATKLTSAIVVGTTTAAALSTTADQTTTLTWSPGTTITLSGEYLFFAVAWEITTASGSNNGDVLIRTGQSAGGSRLVTPDFTDQTPTFPNEAVRDNFQRADGPLTAPWFNQIRTGGDGFQTSINTLKTMVAASWDGISWGSTDSLDQEAYITIGSLGTAGRSCQIHLRRMRTADTAYVVNFLSASGNETIDVYRRVNGVDTPMGGSDTSRAIGSSDSVGVRVVGGQITVWHKPLSGSWSLVCIRNDASPLPNAGTPALYCNDSSWMFDNWGAPPTFANTPISLAATLTLTPDMLAQKVAQFPAAAVVDDFNRANQNPPGSNWKETTYADMAGVQVSPQAYWRCIDAAGGLYDWHSGTKIPLSPTGSVLYRQPGCNPRAPWPGYSVACPNTDGASAFYTGTGTAIDSLGDTFSFEMWLQRLSTTDTDYQYLFSKGPGAPSARLNTAGKIEFLLSFGAMMCTSTVGITDLNPHHVIVSKTGSNIKIYIDGEDVSAATTNATPNWGNSYWFFIGAGNSESKGSNFRFSDVSISNLAVTATAARSRFRGNFFQEAVSSQVFLYSLGEPSGTTARGFGVTGLSNATYVNCIQGQASAIVNDPVDGSVGFNSGGRVEIPHNQSYTNGSGDWGIEVWVNPSAACADDAMILGHGGAATNKPFVLGYGVKSGSAQRVWAGFYVAATTTWSTISDTTDLPLNQWTHLALTYVASSGLMTLYRNAVQVAQGTLTGPATIALGNPMYVGAHWSSSVVFPGLIDEIAFWNSAWGGIPSTTGINNRFSYGRGGLQVVSNQLQSIWSATLNYIRNQMWWVAPQGTTADFEVFATLATIPTTTFLKFEIQFRKTFNDATYYGVQLNTQAGNDQILVRRATGTAFLSIGATDT